MREHFSLCEATYTVQRAPVLMRKFCIKYSQSHPEHETVRLAMARIKSREDFEQVLLDHYAGEAADRDGQYVPREVHRSQEEC